MTVRRTLAAVLQNIITAVALLGLAFGPVACATVASNLPRVIGAVTDAIMVLDTIQNFVDTYFAIRPDKSLQDKVAMAFLKTRTALNLALRVSQGADDLNQAKIDEAFKDFKAAYAELIALIAPLGVTSGQNLAVKVVRSPGHMDALVVPEPLALSLQAK